MPGRLGIVGLIALIALCALSALVLVLVGLGHQDWTGLPRPAYARIKQVAGIVTLFRETDPARWPDVLRAVDGEIFHAAILPAAPAMAGRFKRAPKLQALLDKTAGTTEGEFTAYTDATAVELDPFDPRPEGRLTGAVWRMPDGRTLVLKAYERPRVSVNLLGLPPGFWVGILGCVLAGLALLATLREMAPLRRLTAEVARFDGGLPEDAATERGTPDVRALARAVRDMQRRVAVLLGERAFLIGAISHDLKTYLTRLRLRAEALPEGRGRDGTVADLEAMTVLIETALAFARGTTVSHKREAVDVADLVAADVAERAASGAPVRLRGEDVGDATVLGAPLALRRVVANLVENAVKFGRSAVDVAVERDGTACRVVVDDDGPGIVEAQREDVFSPFYRVDGSRNRRTGGTGLGLAIARQIVEAHGGTVSVTAGPLGGARFTVALPAVGAGPREAHPDA